MGQAYKMAEIEKVFLDYVYFNPKVADKLDFYEWRFNSEEFLAKADMGKLQQYAIAFKNKKFSVRIKKILEFIKKEQE